MRITGQHVPATPNNDVWEKVSDDIASDNLKQLKTDLASGSLTPGERNQAVILIMGMVPQSESCLSMLKAVIQQNPKDIDTTARNYITGFASTPDVLQFALDDKQFPQAGSISSSNLGAAAINVVMGKVQPPNAEELQNVLDYQVNGKSVITSSQRDDLLNNWIDSPDSSLPSDVKQEFTQILQDYKPQGLSSRKG